MANGLCMYLCLYVCMYVFMYVCMYVCLYVCMVCMYECMYVCTNQDSRLELLFVYHAVNSLGSFLRKVQHHQHILLRLRKKNICMNVCMYE
jgi:hypothetical protein